MADKKQSLLSWSINNKELDKQVNQYSQLKLHQSFRGISVLILSFGTLAGIVVSMQLSLPIIDILFGVVFASILIYFIYNGHRWAMIVSILVVTANVLLSSFDRLADGTFSTTSLILIGAVWLIVVGYLIKAIRVENRRKKEKHSREVEVIEDKKEWQPTHKQLFKQLIGVLQENKKNSLFVFGFIVIILVSFFTYSNYLNSKKQELFCIQSISYISSRYFIEDSNGSRIRKPNGKTAVFKTKNDAMEYCLVFLETEKDELSFADKIRPLETEKKSFTLEEIFNR
jgi:hypothetical protein